MHLLVATGDDSFDPFIAETAQIAFGNTTEINCYYSTNAAEIESLITTQPIDLIMTIPNNIVFPSDNLPYKNKRLNQIKQLIKKVVSVSSTKIILLSTLPFDKELLDCGASEWISIPAPREDLIELIKRCMGW